MTLQVKCYPEAKLMMIPSVQVPDLKVSTLDVFISNLLSLIHSGTVKMSYIY